jgi:hypothetical protein
MGSHEKKIEVNRSRAVFRRIVPSAEFHFPRSGEGEQIERRER